MHDFVQAISAAFTLIGSLDPEIAGIVALSLSVSLSAAMIAMVIGAPLGGALAVGRFRGRQTMIVLATALLWLEYGDLMRVDGLSRARSIQLLFLIGRGSLLTAFLAAFGRAIAEVGAIIIVGGNIRGYTRTMTTTIALETSKGELSLALALGLILIL